MDKSEILVHISAPSGAGDDARYRAQVEAILNFQPHSRELITLRAAETQPCLASLPRPPLSISPQPNTNGSVSSPPRVYHSGAKRPASQKDSLGSPVSVIPDSQPQQPDSIDESVRSTPSISFKRSRVGFPLFIDQPQYDAVRRPDPLQNYDSATTASTIINTQSTTNVIVQDNQEKEKRSQRFTSKPEEQQWLNIPSLPLEIKPPAPPVSSSPFTTHITPTLEMLTKRLKSPRTYNPTEQMRDLDDLERGYWYLRISLVSREGEEPAATIPDPSSWETPFFTKFWNFLSDFIAKEGRAGWGVWCIAEEESAVPRNTEGQATHEVEEASPFPLLHSRTTPSNAEQLTLKVYAWGEIACHIYLLLFLASERRVRKMGAQWRDARDEVVIQMP
ncbi:hypothetical protein BJY01DRAFT_123588 [Aspergillus pseudoustus]|uniref:Acetamidase n=1 Tax=Aspergillus pseudoustus TaxID=1810923 RepID=A0ABR4IP95_9EURO